MGGAGTGSSQRLGFRFGINVTQAGRTPSMTRKLVKLSNWAAIDDAN